MISPELKAKEKERRKKWDELRKQKREERGVRRPSSLIRTNQHQRSDIPDKLKCIHREGFLRYLPCKSCCGSVQIKVYGCEIHNECSFYEKAGHRIKYCFGCEQREPNDNTRQS